MEPGLEEVGLQLERLLASEQFQGANRLSRFLRFVTERTLAGEGERLKEYVIGVEVFDRDEHYDPRVDSIVRVEAGRLRTRLEQYYQGPGRRDPLVIRLPKGSYVPQFDRPALPDSPVTPGADASGGRRAPLWLALVAGSVLLLFLAVRHFTAPAAPADPAVAVLPFVPVPDTPENRAVAEALTAAVTDALVRNGAVGVVPRRKVAAVLATQTVQEAAGQLGAEWLVEARVIAGEDLVQLEIRISNAARNRKVWVHDYSGNLRETTAIAAEAARGVTEALSRDQHVPAR